MPVELDAGLQCNVCWNRYNAVDRRPWDIGCGHTFCEACLRSSPHSFRNCPECRARANNPHVSIALLRMLDGAIGDAAEAAGTPARGRPRNDPPPLEVGSGIDRAAVTAAAAAAAATVQQASQAVQGVLRQNATHQQQLQAFKQSIWVYVTPILSVLYMLSPLDIIPDFIPVVGVLDDLVVLLYFLWWMFNYLATTQQQQRRNAMRL